MAIVAITPFEGDKVFGDFCYSGDITSLASGKKEIIASFIGANSFNISGLGCILNTEDPNDALILKCIQEGREIAPFFTAKKDGTRGPSQRFKIKDNEKDAQAFIKQRGEKKAVEDFIETLKESGRLRNFALIFGIVGSDSVVYANLLKMCDDENQRKILAKHVYHNDRGIIELLHIAMQDGNSAEKTGVYKLPNGMYYMNDVPMGLGLDQAVTFLKREESEGIYQALKDAYLKPE